MNSATWVYVAMAFLTFGVFAEVILEVAPSETRRRAGGRVLNAAVLSVFWPVTWVMFALALRSERFKRWLLNEGDREQ